MSIERLEDTQLGDLYWFYDEIEVRAIVRRQESAPAHRIKDRIWSEAERRGLNPERFFDLHYPHWS